MGRLSELMGRGRAMEIVLGGNDFPAQLAAEYRYVNRVLPEGELDDFVDTFARRIASFDKAAISGTKEFVDAATAIPPSDYAASVAAFRAPQVGQRPRIACATSSHAGFSSPRASNSTSASASPRRPEPLRHFLPSRTQRANGAPPTNTKRQSSSTSKGEQATTCRGSTAPTARHRPSRRPRR